MSSSKVVIVVFLVPARLVLTMGIRQAIEVTKSVKQVAVGGVAAPPANRTIGPNPFTHPLFQLHIDYEA